MFIFSRRNNIFSPSMISIPSPNSTIKCWPTPTILRLPYRIDMSGEFSISAPVGSGQGNSVIKNGILIDVFVAAHHRVVDRWVFRRRG